MVLCSGKINQIKKDRYCIYHLHVESKNIQQTSGYNKKEETQITEQTSDQQRRGKRSINIGVED